jgi:hypothetical protein
LLEKSDTALQRLRVTLKLAPVRLRSMHAFGAMASLHTITQIRRIGCVRSIVLLANFEASRLHQSGCG